MWKVCGNRERNGIDSIRKRPAGTLVIFGEPRSLSDALAARGRDGIQEVEGSTPFGSTLPFAEALLAWTDEAFPRFAAKTERGRSSAAWTRTPAAATSRARGYCQRAR